MLEPNYGEEEWNDLIDQLESYEGDDVMVNKKIEELMQEVETYRQAVQDAKDALASAERDLSAALEDAFSEEYVAGN